MFDRVNIMVHVHVSVDKEYVEGLVDLFEELKDQEPEPDVVPEDAQDVHV